MSHKFGFESTVEEVAAVFKKEIQGKTVLITGVSWGGLGAEAGRVMAKNGAGLVILAARRQEALDETIQKIKAETPTANLRPLVFDLASFDSIRKAAKEVNEYAEPIDVLINNAGIMASPYHTTKEGFEAQFGTNHLGPFLFTNLILPKILASKTGAPRIINVSSILHVVSPVRFDDPSFQNGKVYDQWLSYGQSKTANILFTLELSNRYGRKHLKAFSIHPGVIKTNLERDVEGADFSAIRDYEGNLVDAEGIKWKTIPQGAATHIAAAFDPSIKDQSGSYLQDGHIDDDVVKPYARDDGNARKLWTLSEELTGQKFN